MSALHTESFLSSLTSIFAFAEVYIHVVYQMSETNSENNGFKGVYTSIARCAGSTLFAYCPT